MLIYHPAYDIYHTCFRILTLLENEKKDHLETERVRLYDFILLFPHELKNVTLPAGNGQWKKKYKETPYNRLPSRKKVFNQIRHYFDLSAQCLISYGALQLDSYQSGLLRKDEKFDLIISQLKLSMGNVDAELLMFFVEQFSNIPLEQLKQRFQYK